MVESRLQKRYPMGSSLTLEGRQFLVQALLVDISLSGFGAELTTRLDTATKLLASFMLPGHKTKISTWCIPVWQAKTGSGFRVGFQFTGLDSAHHTLIADHLARDWQATHPVI
jgi:hypothetical protein